MYAFVSGRGCVETDRTYLKLDNSVVIYCFINNTSGSYNLLRWRSPMTAILALNSGPTYSMRYVAAVVGVMILR